MAGVYLLRVREACLPRPCQPTRLQLLHVVLQGLKYRRDRLQGKHGCGWPCPAGDGAIRTEQMALAAAASALWQPRCRPPALCSRLLLRPGYHEQAEQPDVCSYIHDHVTGANTDSVA